MYILTYLNYFYVSVHSMELYTKESIRAVQTCGKLLFPAYWCYTGMLQSFTDLINLKLHSHFNKSFHKLISSY